MRRCKFCAYAKRDFMRGRYSCFCTKKNGRVVWQKYALFCRHYLDVFVHRYFEAEREMWAREIRKGIERAIAEQKEGGGYE